MKNSFLKKIFVFLSVSFIFMSPAFSKNIKKNNVLNAQEQENYAMNLYKKTSLHKKLCNSLCGKRYNKIEIRDGFQVESNKIVVCLDTSTEELKNNIKYSKARNFNKCDETHGGSLGEWCISYNKKYKGINLGAYLQCAGLINN